MNLKIQLQSLIESQQLSAAELARRSGVSKQVISLWLSGSEPKHIDQVRKVSKVLGVSIEELCFSKAESPNVAESDLNFNDLIGDRWISGLFEVRLRRVKRG